jgi:hypothetical protein
MQDTLKSKISHRLKLLSHRLQQCVFYKLEEYGVVSTSEFKMILFEEISNQEIWRETTLENKHTSSGNMKYK